MVLGHFSEFYRVWRVKVGIDAQKGWLRLKIADFTISPPNLDFREKLDFAISEVSVFGRFISDRAEIYAAT